MMMWIPIKVGVGLRRPTLELGLSTEAEEKSEDLVYSSEPCMSIGKLVDMGKRLKIALPVEGMPSVRLGLRLAPFPRSIVQTPHRLPRGAVRSLYRCSVGRGKEEPSRRTLDGWSRRTPCTSHMQ